MNKHKYGLYEQDAYDPLQDKLQECYDKFWMFPEQTLEDLANQVNPPGLPTLRSRSVAFF